MTYWVNLNIAKITFFSTDEIMSIGKHLREEKNIFFYIFMNGSFDNRNNNSALNTSFHSLHSRNFSSSPTTGHENDFIIHDPVLMTSLNSHVRNEM